MGTNKIRFLFFCSVLAFPSMRTVGKDPCSPIAVAVKRCLRHTPQLGWLPQAAAGSVHSALCSLHGVQTLPRHRLALCFVISAAFFSLRGCYPWTTKRRTPPCTTATLLSRPRSCSLQGLPTTSCCECSPHWGMCLSLLPWSFLSHSSASSCFGWA